MPLLSVNEDDFLRLLAPSPSPIAAPIPMAMTGGIKVEDTPSAMATATGAPMASWTKQLETLILREELHELTDRFDSHLPSFLVRLSSSSLLSLLSSPSQARLI